MSEIPQSSGANSSSDAGRSDSAAQSIFWVACFREALFLSIKVSIAVVVVAFVLFIVLRLVPPTGYGLSSDFNEWTTTGEIAPVGDLMQEFLTAFGRIGTAVSEIVHSLTFSPGSGQPPVINIAGVARLLSLLAISIAVWRSYRSQLEKLYVITGQKAQLDDFRELRGNSGLFFRTKILYGVATLFGSYVVVSLIWRVLSGCFDGSTWTHLSAWIVILLFVWAVTFGATLWAIAVTTRGAFYIGAATVILGFALSVSIALNINGDLSQLTTLSSLGQEMPSAPFFTASLVSLAFVLWLIWDDIDSLVDNAPSNVPPKKSTLIMLLYSVVVIGLLLVGFVRVGDSIAKSPLNFAAHTVFGAAFAIGGLFFVCQNVSRIIRATKFTPWYDRFFRFAGATSIIAVVVSFVDLDSKGLAMPDEGRHIISLAVAELIIFALTGVLLLATIEMLLRQADSPRNGSGDTLPADPADSHRVTSPSSVNTEP